MPVRSEDLPTVVSLGPGSRLGLAILFSAGAHLAVFFEMPVSAPHRRSARSSDLSVVIARDPANRVSVPGASEPGAAGFAEGSSGTEAHAPGGFAAKEATSEPEQPAVPVDVAAESGAEAASASTAVGASEPVSRTIEVPHIEDPEFLPARLLDVVPRPIAEVALRYPEQAAEMNLSGVVTLLLYIDELGVVTDVTVLAAEPPGYFEEAAVESFKGALFAPGQRNGRPVKSRIPVEVTFEARTDSTKSP